MLDEDSERALREPASILHLFELAAQRAQTPQPTQSQMTDPFEYISAEHIADDRLLVDLFAKSCPWLSKVDGPDPVLVTGPRGCGKSTIFRWLSLKAHLHKPKDQIEPRIIGFYISCSSDLQNRLGWLRSEADANKSQKEVVHYFNLLVTREIVQTLIQIRQRDDHLEAWGLGDIQEALVFDFLIERLTLTDRPRIQGVSRLEQALEYLEASMFETHTAMLRDLNVAHPTPETLLGDLTELLSKEISGFAGHKISFLLDDFSDHRLPAPVQRILNRVIWERRPSHVFKLSSEKYGAVLSSFDGATIDVNREMQEIDCGQQYLALDNALGAQRARTFAIELLNLRLQRAGYLGTAEDLIGDSHWEEGSLAQALKKRRGGRSRDEYHGLQCIADLCSGDISTLLLVYRRIFERANVTAQTTTRIPKFVQRDAIVSTSRLLLEAIKAHFPLGEEMYSVANVFGNFVRRVMEGNDIKQARKMVPDQCPRIEIDVHPGTLSSTMSSEQTRLADELVKRSIFIEMQPGLSRHNFVSTRRWHFRRIYLPHFGAPLAKNDAIKQDIEWFKQFLLKPQAACDMELLKRNIDPNQATLPFNAAS